MKDVIIIGSGPAGLAAAVYTARARLSTVVLTGMAPGGQVSQTCEIDNYPGFGDQPTGAELAERFVHHAEQAGADLVYDEVDAVDFAGPILRVMAASGPMEARAVVVATGAAARRLGVPGEEELLGRGVSYCATCDGPFFRGKDVLVVGGGDSAVEEALFLTRFARSIRIAHRRDRLRAGAGLQHRAMHHEQIGFEWSTVVREIRGGDHVEAVVLRSVESGADRVEPVDGVFIFIGHDPRSALFQGVLALDSNGYVIADERMRTSVRGVYAAGEIMDPIWRQVSTSVGQGSAAGMSVVRDLGETDA